LRRTPLRILISGRALTFEIGKDVYEPSDDSFLLAGCVSKFASGRVLDMGTGCGIQAIIAAQKSNSIVAADISKPALECAKKNAAANGVAGKIEFRESNLFSNFLPNEKFDTIIFNPPYLPTANEEKTSGILDAAWNGGRDGRKIIDAFLNQFPPYLSDSGKLLLLHCHLADTDKTIRLLEHNSFKVEILDKTLAGNEALCIIKAVK